MKASDFVSTSSERDDAAFQLIQTEETDAVNSGLVGSADKSGSALKGASVIQKAAKGGVSNAALAAVTSGRKGSSHGKSVGDAVSSDSASSLGDAVGGGKHPLKSYLKRAPKAAAHGVAARAVGKTLEGTELEGADNLYYKGKAARNIVRYARKRFGSSGAKEAGKRALSLSGRNVATASADKPLGALSEKGGKKAKSAIELKRKAQMSSYFKHNVYSHAAQQAAVKGTVGKGVTAVLQGGVKGFLSAAASAAAPLLFGVVALVLVIGIISAICGGAAEEERQQSASLDGMPQWVTYDLVLACLEARDEYGYPASALLGQMMIENGTSDEGSSLGRDYHNYGGVKYSGSDYGGLITGSVRLLTTEYNDAGRPYHTYAYFAVFASDEAYMTYRCEYLYKQSNYTRVPEYQRAIDTNDSELFLRALGKGGYYTTSQDSYIASYRSICNSYPLVPALDSMTVDEFANRYTGTSGGQDSASAEQWQKDIVNAAKSTPSPGAGLCATWTTNVYSKCGYTVYGNGNSQLGNQGGYANYYPSRATTDLSQIQVGMLVSAQFGSNSRDGNLYGHVAIYIGDGKVMDNIGYIREYDLSQWASDYGRGWVVCGYPWDWR